MQIEQRHLRAHVDRVGHFKCHHCAKEFSVKHKFQRHLRLHVAERRFACAVCGRAFLQREFLARHALTHSGATPFACATCGKAFNQLVNLRQHQQRVHRDEDGALRHECGVCDKVSSIKRNTCIRFCKNRSEEVARQVVRGSLVLFCCFYGYD